MSLNSLKGILQDNQEFYVAINLNTHDINPEKIGFTTHLELGEIILPKIIGTSTKKNAEGYFIKMKDQPMEKVYRQAYWEWTELHGKEKVYKSKIVDIPYKRYPRSFFPPYSIELEIVEKNNQKMIISPIFQLRIENEEIIKNTINLFLECFEECEILKKDFTPIIRAQQKRLNWEILPPGEYPWERIASFIEKSHTSIKENNRIVVNTKIQYILKFKPKIIAYGKNGFNGYYIFGFPSKKAYILESNKTYNATYILGDDWEKLCQLTKAELLNENLHKARFIHKSGWSNKIKDYLTKL